MQTELQFLVDLLLNSELNEDVKKKCIKRIGVVESSMRGDSAIIPLKKQKSQMIHGATQAPSTIAAMQRHAEMPEMPLPTPTPAAQRIIGGEVSTGNGTKGPRKF